jgi:hypothetical protein
MLVASLLVVHKAYQWFALLLLVLSVSWGVTGLGALWELLRGAKGNWLQYLLISVCSMTIVICVGFIESVGHKRRALSQEAQGQLATGQM